MQNSSPSPNTRTASRVKLPIGDALDIEVMLGCIVSATPLVVHLLKSAPHHGLQAYCLLLLIILESFKAM